MTSLDPRLDARPPIPSFWGLSALTALLLVGCSSSSPGASSSFAAEAGGIPVPLVTNRTVYAIAVDATHVYAILQSELVKVPIAGGSIVRLATLPNLTEGLAVTGGKAYWASVDTSSSPAQSSVDSIPVAGGPISTLTTVQGSINVVAADAANVYWAGTTYTATATCTAPPCPALTRVPLGGGAPVVLTSTPHQPTAFAFDDKTVYFGTNDGRVMSVPKAGGTAETRANYVATSVQSLGLSGNTLSWAASGGDVFATPIDGGTSRALEVGISSISAAVTGSDGVYWFGTSLGAGNQTSPLSRTPLDGGATVALWPVQDDSVYAIALDAANVYFSTGKGGLLKLAR